MLQDEDKLASYTQHSINQVWNKDGNMSKVVNNVIKFLNSKPNNGCH